MKRENDPLVPILAIVPARGGSKGIPRKNLCRVAGKSLIEHACGVAAQCSSINRVVITSDDTEMGLEGLKNGAHLFVSRPDELATDEAGASETWRHAWVEAEREFGERFEVAVWLQPTSPTRTVKDVESTLDVLLSTCASAAVTVSPVPMHFVPHKLLTLSDSGRISPFLPGSEPNIRRQDIPTAYWLNGHCYASRREPFFRHGLVLPEDAVALVIDRPVANIDDAEDLERARWLLSDSQTASTRGTR